MDFFITKNSTLPILTLALIKDGRFDYHKLNDKLEYVSITFSMRDVNTNKLVVANKEANIIAANMNQTTEYYIIYKWNANDTKREGRYEAQFDLTFSDDGSKLIVPIREKLYINVLGSFVKSN
jgi:aminopeptidase-like protein